MISALAFDTSERQLISAAVDGTVKVWNFSNGQLLKELRNEGTSEVRRTALEASARIPTPHAGPTPWKHHLKAPHLMLGPPL